MCVKLHSVCVKLHSVCVKLHTVCEITQCAQNYTYSIGKKSSQLKNFTLTPWAAWVTNISCEIEAHLIWPRLTLWQWRGNWLLQTSQGIVDQTYLK